MKVRKILILGLLVLLLSPKYSLAGNDYKRIKKVAQNLAPHATDIDHYAWWVYTYAKKYDLDPYLILAIIKVESDFNPKAASHTGDYSIAQINYRVWKKELERQGIHLNFYKLKTNYAYALDTMAYILKHLKTNYEATDPKWYARYHSNTKKFKTVYFSRVNKQLNRIESLKKNHLVATK